MTPSEFKAALQAAFNRCDLAACPLSDSQKQILLQVVEELTRQNLKQDAIAQANGTNPLDELTPEQRRSFLQFVRELEKQNRLWKVQLLDDWLQERNSGPVQFIRDLYGPQWLNRVQRVHFNKYAESEGEESLSIKVGDSIEVSNGLWEWVQETGPCGREWFPCTVVAVSNTGVGKGAKASCTIRFSNGAEYEIQGCYQWNRYNWRWPSE